MNDTERKHGCGGTLRASMVLIQDDVEGVLLTYFSCPGLICDKCGVEFIEPDTMVALQKRSQTPIVTWPPNPPATTQPDETVLGLLPATANTAEAVVA